MNRWRQAVPLCRRHALLAGAFGLPTLLLFGHVLLGGEVFFSRDIEPFFYPMKAYLAASVRNGVFPLWNPWILNGEPFFASLQPAVLYPGSLLLYLLPMPFAFGLLVAVHFPLAGAGMWTLFRRWGHSRPAALTGALAFMLGGYFVSIGNFPNNLQTVAWIPWAFVAWDRFLQWGRARDALWFALVCAVAFLGGEPQMLGLGLLLLFVHGLFAVERRDVPRARQWVAFAAAGALALALVAVQLLPFIEFIRASVRALELDMNFAAGRSMEPRALVQLAVPPVLSGGAYAFTTRNLVLRGVPWLLSLYPGAIVLLLAGAGVLRPKSLRWLSFWCGVGVLGILLALGQNGPLYPAFYHVFPPIRPLRYPEKFYFLTAVALPVLAARGVDEWLELGARAPRRLWILLATGAVAYVGSALLLWLRRDLLATTCAGWLDGALLCGAPDTAQALYARRLLETAALILLFGAASGLYAGGRLSRRVLSMVCVMLVAVELVIANGRVNPSARADVYRTEPWAARILDRVEPDRQAFRFRGTPIRAPMGDIAMVTGAWELTNMYMNLQGLGANSGMIFGRLAQDGLQGVELASVTRTIEPAVRAPDVDPVRLLRLMNVRYYSDATAAADSFSGLVPLATHPWLPIRIFQVRDPLPRAYAVGAVDFASGPDEALARALRGHYPMKRRVVLEQMPERVPDASVAARILESRYRENRVDLRVRADGPAMLVLTDRYYPGWRAEVNGRRATVYRANGVFRAVMIPAGESVVHFWFAPASLMLGGWISAIAVAILLLGFVRTGGRADPGQERA